MFLSLCKSLYRKKNKKIEYFRINNENLKLKRNKSDITAHIGKGRMSYN